MSPNLSQQSHPFAQYVRILGRGKKGSRSLSYDEAHAAMSMIVNGDVEAMQLGAFLMLLRVKEESPEELAGFVQAIRDTITPPSEMRPVDLDWSSYAGKRQHHPWYLLAALALADSGVRVLMHGTRGHTPGRLYTEDTLGQLDIAICMDWRQVDAALERDNFAYIPIAGFCPPMEDLLQLKPVLGLRSVANSLARLLNPATAQASLHSIFHPRYGDVHQQTLKILGQPRAAVFKGEGGEVERKPNASCKVLVLDKGSMQRQTWPRLLEGRADKTETPGVQALVNLWQNEVSGSYGYHAVVGTLAIALQLLNRADSQQDALEQAIKTWDSRNRSRL
jgi:anthranilate phosphoribosyltransferase